MLQLFCDTILDAVNSGVLVIDLKQQITFCNKAAKELLFINKDVVGCNLSEVLSKAGVIGEYLFKTLEVEKEFQLEQIEEYCSWLDRTRYVSLSSCLLRDERERILGAAIVFQEISQEIKIQQREILAAIGEMAAAAIHEIKNPLAVIRGFVQLIQQSYERKEYCEVILNEIDRINDIVQNLMTISRTPGLKKQVIEMVSQLEDVLDFFRITLFARRVEAKQEIILNSNFINEPVYCEGNASQLRQVFLNLLQNSLEAIGKEGLIEVICRKDNGWVKIEVKDNGCGISPEDKGKLFIPFFTTKEKGTGLGLLTCKRVVEMYGGNILIESEKGRGTVVTVVLPVIENHASYSKGE